MKGFLSFLLFLFLCCTAGFSQSSPHFYIDPWYPESSKIREEFLDAWLQEDSLYTYSQDIQFLINDSGIIFALSSSIDTKKKEINLVISPLEQESIKGTWIFTRNIVNDNLISVQIFPNDDENIYLLIRPWQAHVHSGKSLIDVFVYGFKIAKNISLGLPLTRVFSLSLTQLVALTESSIPWDLLFLEPNSSYDIESMVAEIRDSLSTLVYIDDGAFDENGYPVYIENNQAQNKELVRQAAHEDQDIEHIVGGVNCSGFAKWIVDGIVRPRVGSGIKIDSLKTKTSSPETFFTEPYRESRDLFFGLDWIRNLASALVSSALGKTVTPDISGIDVQLYILPEGTGYKKDVGYKIEELLPLLYYLAVREPGHFYFGAISRERGDPPLRQYHHVVAFFPWIDKNGRYRLVIFENAEETSQDSFIQKNKDAWIHLVRLKSAEAGYFYP